MKNRNHVILMTAIAIIATTATRVAAQSASIDYNPAKSRYARNEVLEVVVTVRMANGQKAVNTAVRVGDTWDRIRPRFNWQWYRTDSNGKIRLRYRVPADPHKDNVYIGARGVDPLSGREFARERRIPIGR